MAIPYDGQLCYAASHERVAYSPTAHVTGGASIDVAATGDLSVDWSNTLQCDQAATGEDAYLAYSLEILEHGGKTIAAGVGSFDKDRDVCRLGFRLRAPVGTLGAGERLPMLALQSSDGTEYARFGVMESGGANLPYLRGPDGTSYAGAGALSDGAWYDFDLLYDAPHATLSLDVSPADAGTWASAVSETAVSGMAEVGVIHLGVLGARATAQVAPRTASIHSLRWQFAEYRRAAWLNGTNGTFSCASAADLQVGAHYWWMAGWAYLEGKASNGMILAKERIGTGPEREFGVSYNPTVDRFRFTLSTDGTNVVTLDAETAGSPEVGVWYFVMAWRAGGEVGLRVNALAADTAAFAGTPYAGGQDLMIGARNKSGVAADGWAGRLSCVAVGQMAEGALAAELATIHDTLYNSGAPLYYLDLPTGFAADASLVSYWDLDDVNNQITTRIDHYGAHNLAASGGMGNAPGSAVVFSPTAAESRAGAERFVGSRIGDVSPSAASVALVYRAGQWRGVTHARIAYQAGTTLDAPLVTAWTDVSASTLATAYLLPLSLTGLTSDQVYTWRIELSRDGTTAHVQSDARTFRTLPAVGSSAAVRLHTWSCSQAEPGTLPNREFGPLLDSLAAAGQTLHRSLCLGDLFYEPIAHQGSAADETTDDYLRDALETFYDPATARLARSTALALMPSDHEVINNGDSRLRTDATARATLANDGGGYALPQNTYGAATTLGDLWDAAYPWINAWYWQPWLTSDATAGTGLDQASGVMDYGRVREIRVDARWTGRAENTSLGAALLAWLQDQVSAFNAAPDAGLLLLIFEAPFTRVNRADDSWRGFAEAEAEALTDYIADTVTAEGKGVVTLVGDKHSVFWADTLFEGAGRVVRTGALKLNVGASPTSAAIWVAADADSYWDPSVAPSMRAYWDYRQRYALETGGVHSNVGKGSGALVTLDPSAGTLSAEYWSDYGHHYQPAGVQDVSVMAASTPSGMAPTVSIDQGASATLTVGDTLQLTVTTTGSPTPTVTYQSSDPTVATVSGGLVTTHAAGSATITATATNSAGSATDTIALTVQAVANEAPTVTITPPQSTTLTVGDTLQLTASVTDDHDSPPPIETWLSSDPSVVTVDESTGLVTAIAVGTVTITASATDSEGATGSDTLDLSVTSVPAAGSGGGFLGINRGLIRTFS